ncbi:MAG: YhcN/YlaJ family sporulation lipoprotein [Acidobacteriota bacterium]
MRKLLGSILALTLVFSALTIGGCGTASKKPVTPPTTTPRNGVTTPMTPRTTTPPNTVTKPALKPVGPMSVSESRKLADRLTNEATKVKGVRSATVVVQPANNRVTAMVGLTLDTTVKGTRTDMIKRDVTTRLQKTDKRVTRVLVTTNPDLVKRIQDIARGVISGKPVQSFATEISELTRRIAPTVK